MALGIGVATHLIKHRALHVENAPVRIVRLVSAIKGRKRLLVLAGISQCTAVITEQGHVARIANRGLLKHSHSLRPLFGRA